MKLIIPRENNVMVEAATNSGSYKFNLDKGETLNDLYNQIISNHPDWISLVITIHNVK